MPLADAVPMAFVHTTDVARARRFYCEVLDLEVVEESPFALVVRAGPILLRVTPVSSHSPPQATVLGWAVPDIDRTMRQLAERGVQGMRVEGLDQDALGVWQSPSSSRVAWFADPDGNTLSVTQF